MDHGSLDLGRRDAPDRAAVWNAGSDRVGRDVVAVLPAAFSGVGYNALTERRFVAAGRRGSPLAKPEWIPSSAWISLKISSLEKSTAEEPAPAKTVIYDIRVFRADDAPNDLEALIEPPDNADDLVELVSWDSTSSTPANERLDPEEACFNWLGAEMRKSPHRRVKPKKEWLKEAMVKFEGLSERAFLRAWDRALRETGVVWGKAGRSHKDRKSAR